MTADTITESAVRDLLRTMDAANRVMTRTLEQIQGGEISPAAAALVVNETVKIINEAAK